jgi:hypothetical protein
VRPEGDLFCNFFWQALTLHLTYVPALTLALILILALGVDAETLANAVPIEPSAPGAVVSDTNPFIAVQVRVWSARLGFNY